MRPNFSVVTPLYNGEDHILDCIKSVQSQTEGCYEHIIIDNMSTDTGPSIVAKEAASDSRIRMLRCEIKGPGPTRNVGITSSNARFVAFLDADDRWLPKKMCHQIDHMQNNDLSFSWTAYQISDQDGNSIRNEKALTTMSRWEMLCKKGNIGCLTAVFDKDRLGNMQMLPFPLRQDFILWNDIMKECDSAGLKYGGLDEVLAIYRVHADGISSDKKKAAKMQWQAYRGPIGLSYLKAAYAFSLYASAGVRSRLRTS